MIKQAIHKLEKAALREIWQHESLDFTPWLAENISLLAEKINMSLEIVDIENYVGTFKADIVAKDLNTGKLVLIENQLEGTDHSHLGQIITYASGLEAETIIWIARDFRDEHLAALDWLNRMTATGIKFYGIQMELWRIGEEMAVNFEMVSKPNMWMKANKEYATRKSLRLSETEVNYHLESILQSLLRQNVRPSGRRLSKETGIDRNKTSAWLKSTHPEYVEGNASTMIEA
jgi:hypothetical protein